MCGPWLLPLLFAGCSLLREPSCVRAGAGVMVSSHVCYGVERCLVKETGSSGLLDVVWMWCRPCAPPRSEHLTPVGMQLWHLVRDREPRSSRKLQRFPAASQNLHQRLKADREPLCAHLYVSM